MAGRGGARRLGVLLFILDFPIMAMDCQPTDDDDGSYDDEFCG
jgi:hypothetical protein